MGVRMNDSFLSIVLAIILAFAFLFPEDLGNTIHVFLKSVEEGIPEPQKEATDE